MKIIRSKKEIEILIENSPDGKDQTTFPQFSYEQGILYTLWWLIGDTEIHPLADLDGDNELNESIS